MSMLVRTRAGFRMDARLPTRQPDTASSMAHPHRPTRLTAAWAFLLVLLLAGCASQFAPALPPPVFDNVPAPATAAEGMDLRILYEQAMAKLADAHAKTATANSALSVIGWAAGLAFLAVPVAWLLKGWRAALVVALFATALAFAPTVLGELWELTKWPVAIGCAVAGAAYLAYWLHRWWTDYRLRRSRDAQLAGGHIEGAAAAEVLRVGAESKPETRKAIKAGLAKSAVKAKGK